MQRTAFLRWVCTGVFTLLAGTFLLGCAHHPQVSSKTTPPRAGWGDSDNPVQDRSIREKMEQEAENLLNRGETVSLKQLRTQLHREACSLRLPSSDTHAMDSTAIAARLKQAVAIVGSLYKCSHCSRWHVQTATGFFITADGAVATCYHVVDQAEHETLVVMAPDGRIRPVREVLAANKRSDLAVLRVEGTGFVPLPLAERGKVGGAVHIISHPDYQYYVYTSGVLSRYFMSNSHGESSPMLSVTADFGKGSSGAPVCDDFGRVVGIVNNTHSLYYTVEDGKKDNLQMVFKNCTPVSELRRLVEHR